MTLMLTGTKAEVALQHVATDADGRLRNGFTEDTHTTFLNTTTPKIDSSLRICRAHGHVVQFRCPQQIMREHYSFDCKNLLVDHYHESLSGSPEMFSRALRRSRQSHLLKLDAVDMLR